MRKITRQAAEAFYNKRKWSSGNTRVAVEQVDGQDNVKMYLHENLIASELCGELMLTLAGWPTPTTKERLNGLLTFLDRPEGFWQSNHVQYFGTAQKSREVLDHEWVRVDLMRAAYGA